MAAKFQVTEIGQCVPIDNKDPTESREVSIRLQSDEGEVLLRMPEFIASRLKEKLEGLSLPPSGMSPLKEL